MKKLLAACLIFILAQSVKAQEDDWRFGVKINPMLTWLKTDPDNPRVQDEMNQGAHFGIGYGIMADYFPKEHYGFGAELRLSNFSEKFKVVQGAAEIDRSMSLQYLELPLTLKMRTNEMGYLRYFAQAGFMPALNLRAKGNIDTFVTTGSTVVSRINNDIKLTDVNTFMTYVVAGAGAEYNPGGHSRFIFELLFQKGFTNIWSRDNNSNFNTKPFQIGLNIGVLF
jgi:hypothetical protein